MVGKRMDLMCETILHGTHIRPACHTRTHRNHLHGITRGESETMRIRCQRIHSNSLVTHFVGLGGERSSIVHAALGHRLDLQQGVGALDAQNARLLHRLVIVCNIIIRRVLHQQSTGEHTRMVTHRLAMSQIADAAGRMTGHQITIGKHIRGLVHTALVIHQFVNTLKIQRALVDDQIAHILMNVVILRLETGGCRVSYRVGIDARICFRAVGDRSHRYIRRKEGSFYGNARTAVRLRVVCHGVTVRGQRDVYRIHLQHAVSQLLSGCKCTGDIRTAAKHIDGCDHIVHCTCIRDGDIISAIQHHLNRVCTAVDHQRGLVGRVVEDGVIHSGASRVLDNRIGGDIVLVLAVCHGHTVIGFLQTHGSDHNLTQLNQCQSTKVQGQIIVFQNLVAADNFERIGSRGGCRGTANLA